MLRANVSKLGRVIAFAAVLTFGGACFGPFASDPPPPTTTPIATPESTPPPTPTAEPVPTRPPAVGSARITTSDLNVRVGPGQQYPVVGRLNTGDSVAVVGRSADEQWIALEGLGWTFFDASWVDLDTPFGELPTYGVEASVAPTHPEGVDTGFPLINEVALEVASGSTDAIVSRLTAVPVPCASPAAEPPGPPCPDDAAPGDPVETIGVVECSAEWAGAAEARSVVERFFEPAIGTRELGLYAVIGAEDDPNATYVVLFAFPTGEGRALWLGDSGAIPRIALACDATEPAGYMLAELSSLPVYYVGPFAPAPLTPAR